MYRQTSRSLLRSAQTTFRHAQPSSRRSLNTAPPHKTSRSWKSSAVRWGIAGAGIYYYNTSPIFAENTKRVMKFESPVGEELDPSIPTIDQYAAEKKRQQEAVAAPLPPTSEGATTDDPAALEEEAESQGAFNPATGEINWDCPCLGGMAHGPCGEDFRAAFSCFVYSEQEPKGLDCIDKFKSMQDCFRSHPEIYAAELEDDEAELDAELAREREASQSNVATPSSGLDPQMPEKRLLDDEPPASLPYSPILSADAPPSRRDSTSSPSPKSSTQQIPSKTSKPQPHPEVTTSSSTKKFDEDLESMPKAWHDSRDPSEKSTGEQKSA